MTDPLDAVGKHDQGGDEGVRDRLGRAGALVLFAAFVEELREEATKEGASSRLLRHLWPGARRADRRRHDGLPVLAIEAVGRAGGGVVEEVRRQFKEKPGIMDRTEKPDYARGRWTS